MKNSFFIAVVACLILCFNCKGKEDTNSITDHMNDAERDVPVNVSLSDKSGKKIPILGWNGLNRFSSVQDLKDMAAAGFSINYGFDLEAAPTSANVPSLFTALDRANEANMQLMIGARWPEYLKGAELQKLLKHPGLAGYFFKDEPTDYASLDTLKGWVERVQKIDSEHFSYINLAGCDCRGSGWAPELIGCTGVEPSPCVRFVRTFADNINVPMISVDRYTVNIDAATKQKRLMPGWYYTLELMSREARRTGKELWPFALSIAHTVAGITYPIPTMNDLRLQMYSNLAYGAQTLQYFTYVSTTEEGFGQAPLAHDGSKTSTYYLIQEMNKELQNFAPVFLGSKIAWIKHTGKIPDGCEPLDLATLPKVFKSLDITGGTGALVALHEKGDDNFLIVVNHGINGNIKVKATGDKNLYRLNRSAVPVELGNQDIELTPGDMRVYFWKK